ncbi:MAG: ureidoglycolate lyase [Rhizobiaceae bacterium]
MSQQLIAKPLTKDGFRAYGEVLETTGSNNYHINNRNCVRHHDLSRVEVIGEEAQVCINIFSAQPYALPLTLTMVERHPLGSQAFYPLGSQQWLVIVCEDDDGQPVRPNIFLASPNQGINLHRGVWHGVLTPLYEQSQFLVIDRVGKGENLIEHHFEIPFVIDLQ